MNQLRKRHCVSALHAHLAFTTKYRRRVITPRVADLIRRSMHATARAIGIRIDAIEADGDHLHLMILYPPALSLSRIVRRLKGASSRFVRSRKLPEVMRRLWGRAFWSPSYFVVSCGGAPLAVVKAYVENQGRPDKKALVRQAIHSNAAARRASYPRAEARGLRMQV